MKPIIRTQPRIVKSLTIVLLLWGTATVAWAQDATNKRGFQAGGSYAISDLETINTTNGNLMLHFPMASLPVGRGGLSASINLLYNSKLYDSETQYFVDANQGCQGGSEEAPCHWTYYQKQVLKPSEDGGWRYGLTYSLKLIDRHDQLANIPPEQQPVCNTWYGQVTPGYYQLRWRYKLILTFPDGSTHEMRPNGWSDGNGDDPLQDYFDIRPDGFEDRCNSNEWHTGTITYYSTDGSFLRLDVEHRNVSAQNQIWWMNPWTLYFPNGMKVTGGGEANQRIYDRNQNYVEIVPVENYNNTGRYAVQIVDQLNRSITWTNDGTNDLIISQGFGETLTTTVSWKTIRAQKSYWPCAEQLGCPAQVQQQDLFGTQFWVVNQIALPSQAGDLHYTIGYNAPDYGSGDPYADSTGWGEVSSVTLPCGAHSDYTYAQDGTQQAGSGFTPDILRNAVTGKDVTYACEYELCNTPTITDHWTYAIDRGGSSITGPDGGVTTQAFIDTQGAFWNAGQVYKTVHPDGTKSETIWAWNELGGGHSNAYPKTEFTSIKDAAGNYAKTAIKDYSYDKNGNVTRVAEYDWVSHSSVSRDANGWPTGIPSGATLVRSTLSGYVAATPDASQSPGSNSYVYWSSGSPNLRNAVAWSEVQNGSNQPLSRTELTYDNGLSTGNVTAQTSWDSTKGSYSNPLSSSNSISATSQYSTWSNSNTGKLTQTTDARGTVTTLTYGSICGFDIYPTQTVAAYGTSVARTETRNYDCGTGLVTSVTDADNNVTTSSTYDAFGRPTLVKAADGKSEETRTATTYSDAGRYVIVKSDLNSTGDGKLVTIQHFDPLGRVRLTRQLEDAANQSVTNEEHGIKVQTRYLFSGSNSYVLTSNPYRATYSNNAGSEPSMGWTRSKSDNAGRVVEVQTFGGASMPSPWGSSTTTTGAVTTAYDANFTTVTDQAGKVRRSMTDGLGRLARVDEPDGNGSLGTQASPNQATSYAYDALGNLLNVYQGSQTRTFAYSSLARLTSAQNPESGTISYTYDNGGNLTSKTDARSIGTTYAYDSLSRVTSRSYSDGTPTVTYTYDPNIANGKGRLASVSSTVSSYSYGSYDALGKPLTATQTIASSYTYSMSYAYNRAGHVLSMTYPSGHTVTNTYDNAGRLTNLVGTLGDNTSRTYSTGIVYAAGGQMTQEQFGTNTAIYNKLFYNSRGQLSEIRESTTGGDTSWNRGAIINHYSNNCWGMCSGSSMPDNNGNLQKQDVYIPGNDQVSTYSMWWQQYSYDSLNRLTQVYEHTSTDWQQTYSYDRFGNRTIDYNNTSASIPRPQFTVDTSNNRLGIPSGFGGSMHYDSAGNLDTDTYSAGAVSRLYDAENRMTKETQASSYVAGEYSYDGDGHRVKRKVGSVETWQIYGIGGELLAEYGANTAASTPQKEYGYRNGQLLITATSGSGYGAAPVLHDNPLVVGETTVQARHITELRSAINTLRARLGMTAYSWTKPTTTSGAINIGDWITADPIIEMRTALNQTLGPPPNGYSADLAQGQPIKAIHIQELRDRLMAVWTADIRWLVSDQLGTPRMVFDQSGSLATTNRHDYFPFGEELFAGTGGRTTAQGYSASDGVRQKFTDKERDIETGLDYFGARYYASTLGRFITPDDFLKDSKAEDAQSWNKYAYVRNNPLDYVDPTGEKAEVFITTDDKKKTGTVIIKASIAVYSADGKVSKDKLDQAAKALKRQIESAYTGTFDRGGFSFTLSAQITTVVYNNEKEAIASNAENIAGFVDNNVLLGVPGAKEYGMPEENAGGWTFRNEGESFDRMLFPANHPNIETNIPPHEFAHGLGEDRHFGRGSILGRSTLTSGLKIRNEDFQNLFGSSIDSHLRLQNTLSRWPGNIKSHNPSVYMQRKK